MCAQEKDPFYSTLIFGSAIVLGIISGLLQLEWIEKAAEIISELFISLLKLISLPIIFLSIISTSTGMENLQQIKQLGKKVLKYTLLTTLLAATLSFFLFLFIWPVGHSQEFFSSSILEKSSQPSYLTFFLQIIPSNVVQPFNENNVIGVLFLALLLSFAIISLQPEPKRILHSFFSSFYLAVMKITQWIVKAMPLAIWAFLVLFIRDLQKGLPFKSLALYLTCVVSANLIQALVVLPVLLKIKGLKPFELFIKVFPALSVAFFAKSSTAALPMSMRYAEKNAGISKQVASFSLPLCTTVNMNGCAAFIFITVLFVSMAEGMVYTPLEMSFWIILSTIAAIGNAGVPMGCYFLASAFLANMGVPLTILGIILPFYAFIDMLESSINVWSDLSVTALVHQELKKENSIFAAT